jgi:hypothetical protein
LCESYYVNQMNERARLDNVQWYGGILNDVCLPKLTDSSKQSVVECLNDLRVYFRLKAVPEFMNLPPPINSFANIYACHWITCVCKDIKSFDEFNQTLTKLLWNHQMQTNLSSAIFQDKYDRRTKEIFSVHFLRYALMAVHLQPRLSELYLMNVIGNHFPAYITRSLLSANLGSGRRSKRLRFLDGSK